MAPVTPQVLDKSGSRSRVLNQEAGRPPPSPQVQDTRPQGREVVSASLYVEQVVDPVIDEPRRADRPIVLRARLRRGIPALDDPRRVCSRRGRVVATDPDPLDHCPAFGDGRLLILRGVDIRTESKTHAVELLLTLPL